MATDFYAYYNQEGFFGFAEKGNFKNFSLAHIIPLILIIGTILLLYRFREKLKAWKHEETFRFILCFVMLFVEMSYFWRLLYVGPGSDTLHTMMTKLPLQICQWSLIVTSFMMMKKSKFLYPISYFVCLSCGIIACLIPNTVISTTGPLYYRYYQFWLEHSLPIISVFYMMWVHGFTVKFKEIWKACIFMVLLGIPSVIADVKIPEANFFYLRFQLPAALNKIIPESLFGRLPLFAIGFVLLFCLAYLPYFLVKKRKEKKK